MVNFVNAPLAGTAGPAFAVDFWPAVSGNLTLGKVLWGALNSGYNVTDNVDGSRLPTLAQPIGVTTTHGSSGVAASGVSQTVFASNANRKGGFILNPPTNQVPVFIGVGTAAVTGVSGTTSFPLYPGDKFSFSDGGCCITDQVNVACGTAGVWFIAQQTA